MSNYEYSRINNQIRNTKINKYRFIILKYHYILFLLILLIIESKTQSLKKLEENANNEIFIIINKTLKREIINNTFNNKISEVIINGNQIVNISEVNNIIINSEYELNNITIKFNNKLSYSSYLFCNLSNIKYIDLFKI